MLLIRSQVVVFEANFQHSPKIFGADVESSRHSGTVFSFNHYDLGKTLNDLVSRQQHAIAVFEALDEDWNTALAEYTLSRIYAA